MSTGFLRHGLETLPPYVPGRRPALLAEGGETKTARLASNESAYGPHPEVSQAIYAAAEEVNRYPDFRSGELAAVLAAHHGGSSAQVTVGNGSSALIRDLVTALCGPGDEVVFAAPSFPFYRNAAIIAGAIPVAVSLRNHRHDLDAMLAAVTPATKLVFVCNPNNPTGTVLSTSEIASFVDRLPAQVAVAVDEAYIDFAEGGTSSISLAKENERVVVLRTLSKAYGLAGLRVGYAFGAPELISSIARVAVPFGVSGIAQAAAIALFDGEAQQELIQRNAEVVLERDRFIDRVSSLGYVAAPSSANFVFLELSNAADAAASLERRGIFARAIGGGLRVTIGTVNENAIVLRALEELLRADLTS